MKIRYIATGIIEHVQNQIGRAQINAGVAVLVDDGSIEAPSPYGMETYRLPRASDPLPPPPENHWSLELVKGNTEEPVLALILRRGTAKVIYTGDPKYLNAKKVWDGGWRWANSFGFEVPSELAKEYARRWKDNAHLRGPYNPRAAQDESNKAAVVQLNAARQKDRSRRRVLVSDAEVEAELKEFNRKFAETIGA